MPEWGQALSVSAGSAGQVLSLAAAELSQCVDMHVSGVGQAVQVSGAAEKAKPPGPPPPRLLAGELSGGALAGLDIRLYDEAHRRKTFPAHCVESCEWEVLEQGGYGRAEITLAQDFGTGAIGGTDRIEIWLDGRIRYRGRVAVPEGRLEGTERLAITAYGAVEALNHILCTKRYVFPAEEDIGSAFQQVFTDFIWLSGQRIGGDCFDRTGLEIGSLDPGGLTSVREALEALHELSGGAFWWGFRTEHELDWTPPAEEAGNDYLFVQMKSEDVKYRFVVGGSVQALTYPQDYSGIVNWLHLTGGAMPFPNLLPNSSFEEPAAAGAESGNVVTNPSFEFGTSGNWSFGGGAEQHANDSNYVARTGQRFALLKQAGHFIRHDNVAVSGGAEHVLEFWQKGAPAGAQFYAEIIPNAGAAIRIPESGYLTGTGVYQRIRQQFTAPVGATRCSVQISVPGSSPYGPMMIDDVALYPVGAVAQRGWVAGSGPSGSGAVMRATMDYGGSAMHGWYHPRIEAISLPAGTYALLGQDAEAPVSVEALRTYQFSAWVRNEGAAAVDVRLAIWVWKTNGDGRWEVSDAQAVAPGGAWHHHTFGPGGWTAEATDARILVAVRLCSVGAISLDAFYFGEFSEGDATQELYVPESRFERQFTTNDAFIANDPDVPAAVKDSFFAYGRREGAQTVDSITTVAQAEQWAKGFFGRMAAPQEAAQLEIAGDAVIWPDARLEVLGAGIGPAWPVRIRYRIDSGGVHTSVDLNARRTDFDVIMARVLNEARASGAR